MHFLFCCVIRTSFSVHHKATLPVCEHVMIIHIADFTTFNPLSPGSSVCSAFSPSSSISISSTPLGSLLSIRPALVKQKLKLMTGIPDMRDATPVRGVYPAALCEGCSFHTVNHTVLLFFCGNWYNGLSSCFSRHTVTQSACRLACRVRA